ncbi:OPT family oligopeptide transporter, partial [bacterium]|nr:OPT family oligopeptide transporter [bacterium]
RVLLAALAFSALLKLGYLVEPLGISSLETLSFDDFNLEWLTLLGIPLYQLHIGIAASPLMFGAGILIGWKVGWSLLLGAVIAWMVMTPVLIDRGYVEVAPDINAVVQAQNNLEEAEASGGDVKRLEKDLTIAYDQALHHAYQIASHRPEIDQVGVLRAYHAPPELLALAGMNPDRAGDPIPTISNPPQTENPYRAGFNWVLWTGVSLMVTSSITALALQYKTIAKTFRSLRGAAERGHHDDTPEDRALDPYPMKWWLVGMLLATILVVVMGWVLFGIPWYMGILAVILSMVIASIAVRATGETDINPVGAMGKITQLVYGPIAPGQMGVNLMAAAVTSAGAGQAGDLMHDLKAGYMMKLSIRKQVIAQILGVFVGVFVVAGVYRVLKMVYEIPGDEFPGPAVYAWYKTAEILTEGFGALPPYALWGAGIGAAVGIVLPLLGQFIPRMKPFLPSTVALGIAFMVPAEYSIAMCLGAFLTMLYARRRADRVEKYGASLASGFIAGEGLMMVAFAFYLMFTQVLFAG